MLQSQENQSPIIDIKLHYKQGIALNSEATEIAYGGAAGGGKSFFLRAALILWCLWIPGLQCYLFREYFDDILKNHVEGITGFKSLLFPLVKLGRCEIVESEIRFWNGSRIYFCFCNLSKHLEKYRGAEMHVLAIEEAGQFTESWLRFLRHRVRMPKSMDAVMPKHLLGKFPRIIYTLNPGGKSHSYFRKNFVKAKAALEIWRTPKSEGGFLRQFIPAKLKDNPSLDEESYATNLEGLNDAEMVKALKDGDWDALVGNYFGEYAEDLHVVPDFVPPDYWFKYRTFDWGSSEPFAVLWFAVSDGEEFEYNGKTLWFPRGALIVYREWYGCLPDKPSKGLKLQNEVIAKTIVEMTTEANHSGITLTDSLPFQARGGPTIAKVFADNGCPLIKADTERVTGWAHVRDKLIGKDGIPNLYICESCTYVRDYLPALERHKIKLEDAADSGEATHICDCIRYGCATFPNIDDAPPSQDILQVEANNYTFNEVYERHLRHKYRSED